MKHHLIYVTGLGDQRVKGQQRLLSVYPLFGIEAELYQMNWADGESFTAKRDRLLTLIDKRTHEGKTVSLIGISAGAAAVVNTYVERSTAIHRVVYVCGKLRGSVNPSYFMENPAFYETMQILPKSLARLTVTDKAKMQSHYAIADPVVPAPCTKIDGVSCALIPMVGHAASIVTDVVILSPRIVCFIKHRSDGL